jgi:hypothetical protein
MQNKIRTPAMRKGCAASSRGAARRVWLGVLLAGSLLAGCGMGGQGAEGSAALLSGMPKCDASLLHPTIAVGAAVGLPGKMIVYVDGVMACVDDAARVEQLFTQIEGHSLTATPTPPASEPTASPSLAR